MGFLSDEELLIFINVLRLVSSYLLLFHSHNMSHTHTHIHIYIFVQIELNKYGISQVVNGNRKIYQYVYTLILIHFFCSAICLQHVLRCIIFLQTLSAAIVTSFASLCLFHKIPRRRLLVFITWYFSGFYTCSVVALNTFSWKFFSFTFIFIYIYIYIIKKFTSLKIDLIFTKKLQMSDNVLSVESIFGQ